MRKAASRVDSSVAENVGGVFIRVAWTFAGGELKAVCAIGNVDAEEGDGELGCCIGLALWGAQEMKMALMRSADAASSARPAGGRVNLKIFLKLG